MCVYEHDTSQPQVPSGTGVVCKYAQGHQIRNGCQLSLLLKTVRDTNVGPLFLHPCTIYLAVVCTYHSCEELRPMNRGLRKGL